MTNRVGSTGGAGGGAGASSPQSSAPPPADPSARLVELTRVATRADGERLREVYALYRAAAREAGQPIGTPTEPGDTGPTHAHLDAVELATAQVVAALQVFHGRAYALVTLAVDLTERLPRILDAMCAGTVTERLAKVAVHRTRSVSPEALPAVEDDVLRLLTGRVRHGLTSLSRRIDEAVERHDAPGLRSREDDVDARRFVEFTPAGPGMMALHAQLPCAEAEVVFTRLERTAARLAPSGGRGRERALADALVELAAHGVPTGSNGAAAPGAGTLPLRPHVTVVVPTDSGIEPRLHFSHNGRSALRQLTDLLQRCRGAVLETVPEQLDPADATPITGFATHLDYRPGEALRRRIRLRDGTCRFPGCSVPAEACDIDHVHPFDHTDPARGGPTTEANLMCLCRRHHRWKTHGRWHYDLRRDARLVIDLPDGRGLVTEPSGPLAEARRATRRHRHELERRRHRRGPSPLPTDSTARVETVGLVTAGLVTAGLVAATPGPDDPPPF